jgi:two-component system NtrC family sensor kinase
MPGAVRLLFVAGVLLPLVIFVFASYANYRVLEDEAHRRASRGADVAREHALRAFAVYELILDQIRRSAAGRRWPELANARDVHDALWALDERSEETSSAFAMSPDGTQWISSRRFPMPHIDGSDREFFRHFRDGGAGVVVSGAMKGRLAGDDFFAVARELRPGEPFDGVAAVSVRIDYFHEVYEKLIEGPEDVVSMVRSDGALLARFPRAFEVGYVFPPTAGLMGAIRQADQGFFPAQARLDGIDRIYAYRKVGPYPVYVAYGLSRSAIWGPWRQNVALFGVVTAIVIALLAFATRQAAERARREREAIEQWARELERRQSAEQALRGAQRLEALGKLTGGVAHDFNNVLQVLKANVEVLRRTGSAPGETVAGIERAAERGTRLTRQLLAFSRQQTLAPERIAVAPFIEGLALMLRQSVGSQARVEAHVADRTPDIVADPHELELAILNLAMNARDALPDGGTFTVEVADGAGADRPAGLREDRDYVLFTCRDTGTGMPPEVAERIFEPFFTTKPEGRGTGLGLAQVYGFVTQSGGTVTVESVVGTGTEFVLWLPAADARTPAADAADSASA